MALITIEEAKAQLKITTTEDDADVTIKVDEASAIVLDYLKTRADPTWTPETCPPHIRAATKKVLAGLWEHRGDDDAPDGHGTISADVESLLARSRDPAFA